MSAMGRRLEGWLFAPGDPRRLAAVRIGLCGLLAIRLARGAYAELATQPPALYRPISFLRLLDRMPSPETVAVLQALALGAQVRAGARGATVVYANRIRRVEQRGDGGAVDAGNRL